MAEYALSTNLVVEDGISDVFHDSGHSLDITLAFPEARSVDAIVQLIPVIPD